MTDTTEPVSARRRRSRDQLLAVLAEHDAVSRADLSRLTGLSRSAVGACVASLLADGLVSEGAALSGASGRGRKAHVVRLRSVSGVVAGIDFGHSHITAAAATATGEILAECSEELDVDGRPTQALDAASSLVGRALAEAGHELDDVLGIAAGIPGPLDVRTQTVRAPTILSDWVGLDPADELSRRLGQPVAVGNDADMGARGERAYGAGQGLDDFLYIKASHGIGAGIVLGGRTYRGSTGIAGEIGHTQLPGATSWCRCGSRGCLETVVSLTQVRRQLIHVLKTGPASGPMAVPPLSELEPDSAAARVITDAGRTVGRVLADLVNCLNPAAIILGGELGTAGRPLVLGVRESVDRYAQPAGAQAVSVRSGRLGSRAELFGALATAVRQRSAVSAAADSGRLG
ncbi:ROK family transcriptional regulator [Streptomyces montanisoli]|uniref:ROK family transcriptional regulator n=1 Tax=Streptomyces montanisoli TaxID=2798581 RepID=UPI001FD82A45|nr:ROK family transcriptional regulator [Streptomyces montanisoli]